MNINNKADYYPWNFRWYARKYQLLSSSYIFNIRKGISEKQPLEDYNWGELFDEYYIVPDLSCPDIDYIDINDLFNDSERTKDKHSNNLTPEDVNKLPHLALAGLDLNNIEDILKFVSSYGLLGLGDILISEVLLNIAVRQEIIQAIIEDNGIETYEDEDILSYIEMGEYIDEYGQEIHFPMKFLKLTNSMSITSKSLIRDMFFPLQSNIEMVNLPGIQTTLSIENNSSLLKLFSEIPEEYNINTTNIASYFTHPITHYYSEPLSLFQKHAAEFQSLYIMLNQFQNNEILKSPNIALQIEQAFKRHLKNVHPHYVYNWYKNTWEKGWHVGTLLEACYLLLYLDVASGLNARYCRCCNTPFIATKGQHYYCSKQCQINDKQKRYRENKKKN